MTFIEKAAAAYRSGKYSSMAAAMKAMSKSKTRSNPKAKAKKSKAKSSRRSHAQSNAAKAMRLYRSGQADSLAEAWAMIR